MSNGRGAQKQLGWTVPSALSSRGTTAATRGSRERGEDVRVASGNRPTSGLSSSATSALEAASAWLTAAAKPRLTGFAISVASGAARADDVGRAVARRVVDHDAREPRRRRIRRAIAIAVPISGALSEVDDDDVEFRPAVVHRRDRSRCMIAASASTPTSGTVESGGVR